MGTANPLDGSCVIGVIFKLCAVPTGPDKNPLSADVNEVVAISIRKGIWSIQIRTPLNTVK